MSTTFREQVILVLASLLLLAGVITVLDRPEGDLVSSPIVDEEPTQQGEDPSDAPTDGSNSTADPSGSPSPSASGGPTAGPSDPGGSGPTAGPNTGPTSSPTNGPGTPSPHDANLYRGADNTRGISDDLIRMCGHAALTLAAAIIHGASERSLVLLDEIGRGTATYDGVSIAWAVTEHLHDEVGAKAIFATHYHELTQLGDLLPGVRNLNVAVRETENDIVFLRRLEPGGADRSYGIQVARLAGFPPHLIARAMELLSELEGTHSRGGVGLGSGDRDQFSLFAPPAPGGGPEHPVVEKLRALEPDRMTPLEALNVLASLRNAVENVD